MKETIAEQLRAVSEGITGAAPYDLVDEVILWALKHAQANPNASIKECIDAGLTEWDV
jgi:hypothetical protein